MNIYNCTKFGDVPERPNISGGLISSISLFISSISFLFGLVNHTSIRALRPAGRVRTHHNLGHTRLFVSFPHFANILSLTPEGYGGDRQTRIHAASKKWQTIVRDKAY